MASIGLLRACKWRTGRSSLPSNRGALTHGAVRRFSNPSARGKDGSRHQPHHRESAWLNHPRIVPTARRRADRITSYLAAVHESAYGTKPTCRDESRMSAFGGKAGQAPWCGFDRLGRGRPNSAIRCSEFLQRKLIVAPVLLTESRRLGSRRAT